LSATQAYRITELFKEKQGIAVLHATIKKKLRR